MKFKNDTIKLRLLFKLDCDKLLQLHKFKMLMRWANLL
jgi:hypothetical protein